MVLAVVTGWIHRRRRDLDFNHIRDGIFARRAGSVDRGDLLLDPMPLTLII
jgi:hypothetical protein